MYYVIYAIFYLLSLLPWAILYLLGDFVCFILNHVLRYRREVVMSNLAIAFPEKSQRERKRIADKFYHNFCDTFIETIKLLSLSRSALDKRFIADIEPINEFYRTTGRNIQLHGGHYFNWEIINAGFAKHLQFPFLGVYMPIKNKSLNKLFYNLRAKYGTILIPATEFRTRFKEFADDRYALGLVADQKPAAPDRAYWVDFFGKPTAFVTGPEKGARLHDTIVVFVNFYKLKRGYYGVEYEVATTEPQKMAEGELTIAFARFLEQAVRKRPDNYLWSHKRWKWGYEEKYSAMRFPRGNIQ